jgi:hypothetical protein
MRLRTMDTNYRLSNWIDSGATEQNWAGVGSVITALASPIQATEEERRSAAQKADKAGLLDDLAWLAWITANYPAMELLQSMGYSPLLAVAPNRALNINDGRPYLKGCPVILTCLLEGQNKSIRKALEWLDPTVGLAGPTHAKKWYDGHENGLNGPPAPWLAWALYAKNWQAAAEIWRDGRAQVDREGAHRALLDMVRATSIGTQGKADKEEAEQLKKWTKRLLKLGADPQREFMMSGPDGRIKPTSALTVAAEWPAALIKCPPYYSQTEIWDIQRCWMASFAAKVAPVEQETGMLRALCATMTSRLANGTLTSTDSWDPCVDLTARLRAMPLDLIFNEGRWTKMWKGLAETISLVQLTTGWLVKNPTNIQLLETILQGVVGGREGEVPAEQVLQAITPFVHLSLTEPGSTMQQMPLLVSMMAAQSQAVQQAYHDWELGHNKLLQQKQEAAEAEQNLKANGNNNANDAEKIKEQGRRLNQEVKLSHSLLPAIASMSITVRARL